MTIRLRAMLSGRSASMAFALLAINFVWEMAQAGYYSSMEGLPFWSATWLCSRAAVADVGLFILCFLLAAMVARDTAWPLHPTPLAVTTFLVACLIVTIGIERWAITTARWSYGADMPLIAGVGVLPLLQWVLIPVLALFGFRVVFPATIRHSS
ncbi:MAG: hypothetical protein WC538_22830 [Thermoanaerobaculia bacterium]